MTENDYAGLRLVTSFNNSFTSKTDMYSVEGFTLLTSTNNTFTSNNVLNNTFHGFTLTNSPNNTITSNETHYNHSDNFVEDSNSLSILIDNNFIDLTVPSEPLNLVVVLNDDKNPFLKWFLPSSDGYSPIIGYKIYRSEESGVSYVKIDNTTSLNYTDTTGVDGHSYYYVIKAVNTIGEGSASKEVPIYLQKPKTTTVTLTTFRSITSFSSQKTTSIEQISADYWTFLVVLLAILSFLIIRKGKGLFY